MLNLHHIMRNILVSVGLAAASVFPVTAHDGNDGWVTVSSFRLWSNTYGADTIRIEAADYYNPAACSDGDSYMVSSILSGEARQRIYATMLAAKMATKPVRLRLDTSTCQDGRPRIVNVMLD
ncbi:MAG: hypothetical protein ACREXR_04785 [Gammaproteobacteria bacterium]